ncbi:MAG TPA: DUF4168 domain-containing protein [Stellaceae bacterium]|jgi:hypothetical protein|nr:DUF4168 domain-containing protein [Stellaceae bacterium]
MSLNARHRLCAKKPRLSASRTAILAFFGSVLCLSQAFGQGQSPANNAPPASAANISDRQIKEAATAIPQVEGIRQNYQQQLAQAPDGDKPRIQGQAGTEMKKAIADQGLSVPEYNSILEAAEQHPEIRTRLIQQMPQSGQAPGP